MPLHRAEEWEHHVHPDHRCRFPPERAAHERKPQQPRIGIEFVCDVCGARYRLTALGWARL